ncbi:DUF2509 family protein [Buttiauxella gaviniae]|uniref:DUF2509 family protein n=1 Tax=Buttiauxella gaviniae TaxID=82990 RepID=A0ABV3NRG2_9ENTR
MLSGLQQQLSHQRHLVTSEVSFIKQYVAAASAQAWGSQLLWQPQQKWQCQHRPEKGWKACVLHVEKSEFVLAVYGVISGQQTPLTLWQWGTIDNSRWLSMPHGWLDFCPLTEAAQCQLPQ